jgi:hypothetical protein
MSISDEQIRAISAKTYAKALADDWRILLQALRERDATIAQLKDSGQRIADDLAFAQKMIVDLEQRADPAHDVRRAYVAEEKAQALERLVQEQEATIAGLREKAETDDDHRNIGAALMETLASAYPAYSWCNCPTEVVVDLMNERDDARQELAELRKPVEVEPEVAEIRKRIKRGPALGYNPELGTDPFIDAYTLLSAYDALAQDCARLNQRLLDLKCFDEGQQLRIAELEQTAARDASAREAMLAEMRGLRERHDDALKDLAHCEKERQRYIGLWSAAEERERQLRECLESLLRMPESQWLEPGSRRTAFIAMRAALAQPQQLAAPDVALLYGNLPGLYQEDIAQPQQQEKDNGTV